MAAHKKIAISEENYWHLLNCTNDINDLFINKFHCAFELKGPKPGTYSSTSGKPVIVYKKRVLKTLSLTVWKDDMTRQDADIVVNAANERLDHIGGLALALANVGGPRIVQESKDYLFTHGILKAGDIAVTSAGNLPCKAIVHAVGPMWCSQIPEKCISELEEVIRNVLSYVDKHKDIRSVAIPAVSSGIFGFPLDLCAETIVRTIHSFFYNVSCDHLKEIRLVNNDDKTVQAMKSACEKVFGISDTLSGASPSPYMAPRSSHQVSSPQEPSTASQSVTINGLTLHLKEGLIQDQNTGVIVNSISSDLNLNSGEISKAILKKAGHQLQQEIYRTSRYNGAMIPTMGYNLSCKHVYHVILPLGNRRQSEQVLSEVTDECLDTANRYGCPSISFPALGTGSVGLSKDIVAEVMTRAVLNFARKTQRNMDVYCVIHPNDRGTFQAFQDKFSRVDYDKKTENTAERRGLENSDQKTCMIIDGSGREEVEEAEAFLSSVLRSQPVVIQNNHILLFGKEEHGILASPSFPNVSIHEDVKNGAATLKIEGSPQDKVRAAVLVEHLLWKVQEKHAETLEEELVEAAVIWFYEYKSESHRYSAKANREIEKALVSNNNIRLKVEPGHVINLKNFTAESQTGTFQLSRQCIPDYAKYNLKRVQSGEWLSLTEAVNETSQEFKDQSNAFKKANLTLVKMEKVKNRLLSAIYESKKEITEKKSGKQSTHHLYQVVHGQFRKQICDVGFQRLYATPRNLKYGVGIYFKKTLNNIIQHFKTSNENGLIYIFSAEVLPGKSTTRPNQLVLPCDGADALELYDIVTDLTSSPEHFVIFDCFRAKPLYLFTCKPSDPVRGSHYTEELEKWWLEIPRYLHTDTSAEL